MDHCMMYAGRTRDDFIDAYLDLYPAVYSSVCARVNDRDEAEDLCQEIFIIFYSKFESIDNRRSWLYSTTKNVLMNYYKKKRADASGDIEEMIDFGLKFVNGFRDTRIIIEEAMMNIRCDDMERVILDLVAVHNYSYTRASEVTGLTVKQVRYRYGQVVTRLLHYMKNIGIREMDELL